jgi:hypothetical protein
MYVWKPTAPEKCSCGGTKFSYVGVQERPRYDLDLFNCQSCHTTVSVPEITRSIQSIAVNTSFAAATSTDYVYIATASAITGTLPTAVGNTNEYTFNNTTNAAITLATTSGQSIQGMAASYVLGAYESITVISDNANWWIQ